MSRARALLEQIVEKQPLSRRQFAKELGWQHTHLSKVLLGEMEVTRLVVARILSVLDDQEAKQLLESFLTDEIERAQRECMTMAKERRAVPKPQGLLGRAYSATLQPLKASSSRSRM